MKIFQKMSSRDRSLLILLLAAVVFYICYTFFMAPSMEKAEILKAEQQAVTDELARARELSGKADALVIQEKQQREDLVKKYSNFFFDLKQSRLLNRVDAIRTAVNLPAEFYLASPELASQVPIENGTYSPQEYPLKELAMKINPELQEANTEENQSGGNPAEGEGNAQEAIESSDMVLGTDVSVGFAGASYESIYNFIGSVEKMNRTVVLKSIDITIEDTGLAGQMIFSFYSIPKLDPDQKDGLDYTPIIPTGKVNPFQ